MNTPAPEPQPAPGPGTGSLQARPGGDGEVGGTPPATLPLSDLLRATPVLVVDDLEEIREVLYQMLAEFGLKQIRKAASGQEALEVLDQQDDVGLVLLDLVMPGMPGYEVARRLSAHPKTRLIPIIIITGGTLRRDEALTRSFQCGAMDFLSKPVNEVELFLRVRSALTLYHERQSSLRKTQALLESHQRYDLAVAGVKDGIFDINYETGGAYYSPNWKMMLGYGEADIPGEPRIWEELIHPEDRGRVLQIVREHWEKHTPFYTSEHRLRTRFGDYLWVCSRGCTVYDEGGQVVRMAGSTTDISERHALEARLRQARQLESLGRLAAGVAHEFNNLLATMAGQASLLRLRLRPDSELRENADVIEQTALRAADLCNKMLAASGEGCYAVDNTDLNHLAEEAVELRRRSLSRQVNLSSRFHPAPLFVQADPAQLRQLVSNLLTNAAEAIGDQPGTIVLRTSLAHPPAAGLAAPWMGQENEVPAPAPAPATEYALLEVEDSGCGMPPDVQEKIFEPFFSTKGTGRGLGLSAVLGITKAHQGALQVHSEPGQGARFSIWLPCRLVAPASAPAAAAEGWQGSGTILLVEDAPDVREMTALMLQELGFDVIQGQDGLQGVELFRQHQEQIALVILDWNMPRMNGEEAFLAMRSMRPKARILIATGYSEQEVIFRFQRYGLKRFLHKPFRFADLTREIQACLAEDI